MDHFLSSLQFKKNIIIFAGNIGKYFMALLYSEDMQIVPGFKYGDGSHFSLTLEPGA